MTDIEFRCTDKTISIKADLLKDSELIDIYVNQLQGEREPIEVSCKSRSLQECINRYNKELSVLPEHYEIADFLQYDYTPSLWTPHEWKDFLNQETVDYKEKEKVIDEVCLFVKENAKIEDYKDKRMFRCQFDSEMSKKLKDQYVKTQVCKRLQSVIGKNIRILNQTNYLGHHTTSKIATCIGSVTTK